MKKFEDSDFATCFEDGTKVKNSYEIKPPLPLNFADFSSKRHKGAK